MSQDSSKDESKGKSEENIFAKPFLPLNKPLQTSSKQSAKCHENEAEIRTRTSRFTKELVTMEKCGRKNQTSQFCNLSKEKGPVKEKIKKESRFSSTPPETHSKETAAELARKRAEIITKNWKKSPINNVLPSIPDSTLLSLIKIDLPAKVNGLFEAKIYIMNLPVNLRRSIKEHHVKALNQGINEITVTLKNSHLTEGKKTIGDPLHLLIQSLSKGKVENAIRRVKTIISEYSAPKPLTENKQFKPTYNITTPNQPTLPTGNYHQEKVFVGIDHNVPEGFDIKKQLIGEAYGNFNYIASSSGCKVILRGRGSGFIEPTSGREAFEAMYVFISNSQTDKLKDAKKLVESLVEKVRTDLLNYKNANLCYTSYRPPNQSGYHNTSQYGAYPQLSSSTNPAASYPQQSSINPTSSVYSGPSRLAPRPYNIPDTVAATPIANNGPAPVPPPVSQPSSSFIGYPGLYRLFPDSGCSSNSTSEADQTVSLLPNKASKRRKFQEAAPDLSKVLGYEQYSTDKGEIELPVRKPKKSESVERKTSNKASLSDDSRKSGRPFWMEIEQ